MDKDVKTYTDTGYGIVMRSVMRSPGVSYCAKSIYAYLCTFADPDGICYPSRDLICRELHMCKSTLAAGLKELATNGYIGIEKIRKKNGAFLKSVFTINRDNHDVIQFATTRETTHGETTHGETTHGETRRGKEDTNNNNINNNKLNNNNINNNKFKNKAKRKSGSGSIFLDMLGEGDDLYDNK